MGSTLPAPADEGDGRVVPVPPANSPIARIRGARGQRSDGSAEVRSGAIRCIPGSALVPLGPGLRTIAPRTTGRPVGTVSTDPDSPVPVEREPAQMSLGFATQVQSATGQTPRRMASIVALAFGITTLGLLVAPKPTFAWDASSYSSSSEKQLVSLTNRLRARTSSRSSTRRATATRSPARTSAGTTTPTTRPPEPSTGCSWTRPATGRTSWAGSGTS